MASVSTSIYHKLSVVQPNKKSHTGDYRNGFIFLLFNNFNNPLIRIDFHLHTIFKDLRGYFSSNDTWFAKLSSHNGGMRMPAFVISPSDAPFTPASSTSFLSSFLKSRISSINLIITPFSYIMQNPPNPCWGDFI